jgi:hypothetical protein
MARANTPRAVILPKRPLTHAPNNQKFFASFFQKRSASFLFFLQKRTQRTPENQKGAFQA